MSVWRSFSSDSASGVAWLGALVALAGLACERAIPAAQIGSRIAELGRPNLVLIVVDTLRADYTDPYGSEIEISPELARWAQEGVVFEQHLSQSSWTKISMASMMTSLWPRSHGIHASTDGLDEQATTLADVLSKAGYRTYGIQTNGWLHQSFGFHQGFDHYVFPIGGKGLPRANIWPSALKVEAEAERLLESHPKGEPFFLYLHYMDVHEFAAPQEYREYGTDTKGAYLASIRWVDDSLERVIEMLDRHGVLDKSIIVFTSDHGEAFGENGKTGHARNVLTTVLEVPMLVRLPFPVAGGLRVPRQTRGIDVAPTLVELAGAPIPDSFEGRSLVPELTGAAAGGESDDAENFAALGQPLYFDASIQISTNDGDWTYARNVEPDPNLAEFLFDRRVDPDEDVNLIGLEPDEAGRMRAVLDAHLEREASTDVLRQDIRIDPAIEQRLRAMGYLQDE